MQLRWFWRDLAAAVGHLDKAAMILNLISVSTSVSTHLVYAALTWKMGGEMCYLMAYLLLFYKIQSRIKWLKTKGTEVLKLKFF